MALLAILFLYQLTFFALRLSKALLWALHNHFNFSDYILIVHKIYDLKCPWMKNKCLLDPINIYGLCGIIGIIGVNLQSKKSVTNTLE